MPTTTIRLPDDLKKRLTQVAERSGTTPHAFMLEAITEKIADDERRSKFHAGAEQRYRDIISSGKTIPWSEVRTYLEQRRNGEVAARPSPRKLHG